jgi:hypothetical protein
MEISAALWKSEWKSIRKLKIELLHNCASPLLGINPDEYKSVYHRTNSRSSSVFSMKLGSGG